MDYQSMDSSHHDDKFPSEGRNDRIGALEWDVDGDKNAKDGQKLCMTSLKSKVESLESATDFNKLIEHGNISQIRDFRMIEVGRKIPFYETVAASNEGSFCYNIEENCDEEDKYSEDNSLTSLLPHHISAMLPRQRTRRTTKSVNNFTSFQHYDSLGECREQGFKWGDFLGCDHNLGRCYYKSFSFQKSPYWVGDFVAIKRWNESEQYFRIIGCFQALKTYRAKSKSYNGKKLQERGYPYALLLPLKKKIESRKRKRDSVDCIKLFLDLMTYKSDEHIDSQNIIIIPEYIGDWRHFNLLKIRSSDWSNCIQNENQKYEISYQFALDKGKRKELSSGQELILGNRQDELSQFLPEKWDPRFQAEQVQQYYHTRNNWNDASLPFSRSEGDYSDDSDVFHEESNNEDDFNDYVCHTSDEALPSATSLPSHISPKRPLEKTYPSNMSAQKQAPYDPYENMGKCHLFGFTWNKFVGFDKKLGRCYFDGFCYKGLALEVGDYIAIKVKNCHCDYFRLVGSYQALKTYKSNEDAIHYGGQQIQERGHPYAMLMPFKMLKMEKNKDSQYIKEAHELCLDLKSFENDDYVDQNNIISLPDWIGRWSDTTVQKIQVQPENKLSEKNALAFKVSYGIGLDKKTQKELNKLQKCNLNNTKEDLCQLLPTDWDSRLIAEIDSDYEEESEFSDENNEEDHEDQNQGPLPRLVMVGEPYNYRRVREENADKEFSENFEVLSHALQSAKYHSEKFKETIDDVCKDINKKARRSRSLNEFVTEKKISFKNSFLNRIKGTHHWEMYMKNKSVLKKKLQKVDFRDRQAEVCLSASNNHDIIYIGPPGVGKSVCFTVPALHGPGITIVIEPLNAIISQQVQKLKDLKIKAEKLLSLDEFGKTEQRSIPAWQRITQLANLAKKGKLNESLILFATPEVFNKDKIFEQLKFISRARMFHRFVLDEFDDAIAASENYRSAYLDLLPRLLKRIPELRYTLLSATYKPKQLIDLLGDIHDAVEDRPKPLLFESETYLPKNLYYSVERKTNLAQAIFRTKTLWNDYMKESQEEALPKTIFYCLTPNKCRDVKELLQKLHQINAEIYCRKTNEAEKNRILNGLSRGTVRVICATTSLGRGVDISDIRFIIHIMPPLSLSNYIQETGRSGRDGKKSFCILFYRPHDERTVKETLRLEKSYTKPAMNILEGKERNRKLRDLDDTREYSIYGDFSCCRRKKLAEKTSRSGQNGSDNIYKDILGHCCDLCRSSDKNTFSFCLDLTKEVSVFIENLRTELDNGIVTSQVKAKKMLRLCVTSYEDKKKATLLEKTFKAGGSRCSLEEDLVRILRNYEIVQVDGPSRNGNLIINSVNAGEFLSQLKSGKVQFRLLSNHPMLHSNMCARDSKNENTHILPPSKKECSVNLMTTLDPHQISCQSAISECNQCAETNASEYENDYIDEDLEREVLITTPVKIEPGFLKSLRFLIHYELCRAYNDSKNNNTDCNVSKLLEKINDDEYNWNDEPIKSCKFIHECIGNTQTAMKGYEGTVEKYEKADVKVPYDEGTILESDGMCFGAFLYFSADLFFVGGKEQLILQPPEKASNRRIYRKFGSHRFLDVRVPCNVPLKTAIKLFSQPLLICGRSYRFLWAKKDKAPQIYVLFAESGKGISNDEETLVEDVQEWMIPHSLNQQLSVEKYFKRAKLSFSKTTPAGILPDGCVKIVTDIKNGGVEMTDGCGLISRELLEEVRMKYNSYIEREKDLVGHSDGKLAGSASSFQARLGGLKGMWVLDPTLEGKQLISRFSQEKYHLPMKSVGNNVGYTNDLVYDTFEVCSWDQSGKESRFLFVQLIQILEHRGVSIDHFIKCAEEGTMWVPKMINDILKGDNESLIAKRPDKLGADDERKSFGLLYRIAYAKIGIDEPIMRKLLINLLRSETKAMRKKARYPIEGCKYLRMLPDHTQLLEEGEAFIADDVLIKSEHIIAMRSPAYFSGDLVKLRYVSESQLRARETKRRFLADCEKSESLSTKSEYDHKSDSAIFFYKLKTGIVLSTKGKRSAADMMSGGDFDGDTAWVCWNEELVKQVRDHSPEDTSSKAFTVKKSKEEGALFKQAIVQKLIEYVHHHCYHHKNLGMLSTMLTISMDYYGLDHSICKALGTEAFLQVDHPFFLCTVKENIQNQYKKDIGRHGEPQWKVEHDHKKCYKKKNALGSLHEYMTKKIESLELTKQTYGAQKSNTNILNLIQRVESKDPNKVQELRNKMKLCVSEANKELTMLIKKHDKNSSEKTWQNDFYDRWQHTILEAEESEDEKRLIMSILYEQTNERSILKSSDDHQKVFSFAWMIGCDILVSIIKDKTPTIVADLDVINSVCARGK